MSTSSDEVFRPGEIVPESGIYECDCGKRRGYSTDVRGHRFPPLQDACSESGWHLKEATRTG